MQNKKEEIQIAIQSELKKVDKLISEYEKLGGKVVNAIILNYDDEERYLMALNGTRTDIGELLLSSEYISDIIKSSALSEMLDSLVEEDEEWLHF